MDMLLSNRALGYFAIVLLMVVAFFLLIEFFGTALILTVAGVATLGTLLRLRSMRRP